MTVGAGVSCQQSFNHVTVSRGSRFTAVEDKSISRDKTIVGLVANLLYVPKLQHEFTLYYVRLLRLTVIGMNELIVD